MNKPLTDAQCSKCGRIFECLSATNVEECWCMALPVVKFSEGEKSSSCWCPDCLQQQLDKQSKQSSN